MSAPRAIPSLILLSSALLALPAALLASAEPSPPIPGSGAASYKGNAPRPDETFRAEVLPILERSCFECHGPAAPKAKGGLRMASRESLLRGGLSGPALVPGDPDESLLIQAVRYDDLLIAMPPDTRLPPADVATLERWVENGAHWPATAPEPALDPEAVRFFEERIRPVLVENCFECHGPELAGVQSGLRMSGRAALLTGGVRGPEIVPGSPDESRLIQAVRYDQRLKMPPRGKLPDDVVRDLERWVELGAPWPGGAENVLDEEPGIDIEAGREWWAFRPLTRPPVPNLARTMTQAGLVRNPIDAFVLARLEEAGLDPNPEADARTLVRRATFGLHGLPPTFEDVEAFAAEGDQDAAWERLVDDLLADPSYGERFGRMWLDLVRFAQTNGYERDSEKVYAWRYRDYVIGAFNKDTPYDRFLLEQLAGDELDEVSTDSIIATGFYRIGAWDDEPDDPEQAVYDEYDDVVRVISEGFLGVTVSCARCHDHKFDPFPQEDYYRMLAFVRNVRPHEDPIFARDSATLRLIDTSADALKRWETDRSVHREGLRKEIRATQEEVRNKLIAKRLEGAPDELRAAFRVPASERTDAQRALIQRAQLIPKDADLNDAYSKLERRKLFKLRLGHKLAETSYEGDEEWTLAVREFGREAPPTHVLARGRPSTPRGEVHPGFPEVLCSSMDATEPEIPAMPADRGSSGRRRALAEWIVNPSNPLTARVLVNRVWQFHFGQGLVPTPNDFGRSGIPPTHPELLDWLATGFVENGWSVKDLHRLVMSSATYRRSSSANNEAAVAIDPSADLLWRQRLRRLDAEAVRDTVCVVAGGLNRKPGGRGFFPELSRGALAGSSRPGEGWEPSSVEERNRRAVYAYVKRTLPVPLLEVLDAPNAALPTGQRSSTTIASQALTLLNGAFVNRQAREFARRVESGTGLRAGPNVERAFELALSRRPSEDELRIGVAYMEDQTRAFAAAPTPVLFRARVPERLDTTFLKLLSGEDFLHGPREGWSYVRGEWKNGYNHTKGMDAERGAAALCERARFRDGVLELGLSARRGTESFGLLLRSKAKEKFVIGVELRFLPEEERVELVHHREEDSVVIASASYALEAERRHELRAVLEGERVRVWLRQEGAPETEAPLLDARDVPPLVGGAFGVRLWGGEVELDGVRVTAGDGLLTVAPDASGPPERRALESLCLTLLNLNEFLYVD
jgi:hypothetical protein